MIGTGWMRWMAALVMLLAATPCGADEVAAKKELARSHYERGTSLFAIERYDEAIKEFEEAYVALPRPDFLYNIGQAHKRAGRPERARSYFERYLELAPGAPDRGEVEKLIAETRSTPAPPPSPAVASSAGAANPSKVEGVAAAPAPPPPPITAVPAATPSAPERKRTWIWGVVGGAAVVVAGAVVLGVVLGTRGPSTDFGTLEPFR